MCHSKRTFGRRGFLCPSLNSPVSRMSFKKCEWNVEMGKEKGGLEKSEGKKFLLPLSIPSAGGIIFCLLCLRLCIFARGNTDIRCVQEGRECPSECTRRALYSLLEPISQEPPLCRENSAEGLRCSGHLVRAGAKNTSHADNCPESRVAPRWSVRLIISEER